MRVRGSTCVSCALLLLSCNAASEPAEGEWYRAERIGDAGGGGSYFIAHVDVEADTCVYLRFDPITELGSQHVPGDQVEIRGGEFEVITAYGLDAWGRRCKTGYNDATAVVASGTIELDDQVTTGDDAASCTLSYALEVGHNYDEHSYAIAADNVPVWHPLCPRPQLFRAEHSELDAAYAEREGLGNLVISTWDVEREVCVIARFLSAVAAVGSPSEVTAPGEWTYSGLRFAGIEASACTASALIDAPVLGAFEDDSYSVGPMFSTGSIAFAELGAGGLPCRLDVDLRLQSEGRYYWAPDDTILRAQDVAVAGCE